MNMTSHDQPVAFVKGHGTGNDFVVLPDPEARLDLTVERVRAICDRRFGIGGDGVLRVVPTSWVAEVADQAARAPWFMDYRNADGSVAEMCGNGARVFARYLVERGLVEPGNFSIATRGGVRQAVVPVAGDVSISMGLPTQDVDLELTVSVSGRSWPATAVHIPNPHAIVAVGELDEAGSLRDAPTIDPGAALPDGANVEFVRVIGPTHVQMRVHERGAGETLSCGTGACAVAWLHAKTHEVSLVDGVRVDVRGGSVLVTESMSGDLWLSGPAELVANGTFDYAWWGRHDLA